MGYLNLIRIILWKDITTEFRTKEIFTSLLVFTLLVALVFAFAFDPGSQRMRELAPGILWVAFTFGGVLGLNRSFLAEKENDCLQGLLLSPMDRGALYLGKMIGNVLFMGIIEIFTFPVFAAFLNLPLFEVLLRLIVVIVLSTIGFAAVGTLFAAMSVNTRTREVMLPILLFPVAVPVIIAAVKATGKVLAGDPLGDAADWLKLLGVFDVIFVVICFLTFEYVVEE